MLPVAENVTSGLSPTLLLMEYSDNRDWPEDRDISLLIDSELRLLNF